MHEFSIAENILEIVDDYRHKRKFKRLTSITLRIGLLSAVDEQALRFAFESLTEDSPDAGAVLKIEKTYPQGKCSSCGCSFEVRDLLYTCPECGAITAELTGGDDLDIIKIEAE